MQGGFTFSQLATGFARTIRASAPGYATKEVTVTPNVGPQAATIIELSKQ